MGVVSDRVVGRLILYRRLLKELLEEDALYVYSHELAARAKSTAAQVRRDLMVIGYSGSPARGYEVRELIAALGTFLDAPDRQRVCLVGVGNLGRALLAYFVGRHAQFDIAAAFDNDPQKVDRVMNGCRIYPTSAISRVVLEEKIEIGVIAVPAMQAQAVATELSKAGVRGVLNFAPVRIWVPEGVFIEHLDVTMSLERVAFFGRREGGLKGELHVNSGKNITGGSRTRGST